VVRNISIRDGQCAVYQEHTVSGVSGEFNYGNHPILRFPDEAGSCLIGTSPFRFGQVYTGLFEDPADAAYSSLQQGGQFDSLERVPLATGGYTDLTVYPARTGFEDLVMMSNPELYLGWTAVTMPGYVWLTLKSPKQFPSTIFWLSNAGRHRPPWNGRHRCRMGIEEVCSYFHEGVESSRERKLAAEGIPTVAEFSADVPTVLRNIQAVHPVEGSFGKVERIEPDDAGIKVTLIGSSGARVDIPLDWTFLE
jgi:hypothetical protein